MSEFARLLGALLLVAGGSAVLVELARPLGVERADALLTDQIVVRQAAGQPPVLLVPIDDQTLREVDDPMVFWGPRFGAAITALTDAGATAVGFDFLIGVSIEEWLAGHGFAESAASRTWDNPLRAAFAGGKTVLALHRAEDASGLHYLEPLPEHQVLLPSARSHLGVAALSEDDDGVLRRFRPVWDSGPADLHFATALTLLHLAEDPSADSWSIAGRDVSAEVGSVRMVWSEPPARLPLHEILDGLTPVERGQISGRIAILGADYFGSQDSWRTPLAQGRGERTAGMEVHAHAIGTLLSGRRPRTLGPAGRLGAGLLMGLALGGLSLATSRRVSGAVLTMSLVLLPVLAWFLAAADLYIGVASLGLVAVASAGAAYVVRFGTEARRHRFLRQVFGRYVSPEVVGEILSSRSSLGLGGKRREVTVLFSDIRNFTTISESLTPEEVVEMLNTYFERVCPPILAANGVVDKFVGDAVMAVFGAPIAREGHARDALTAALGMATAAVEFRGWMTERFPDRPLPAFDMGVGVHTGFVVAGNVGFSLRTEYTVIGDTVNIAARVESLTKTLGVRVLASRECLDAAGPGFETGLTAEVAVKGRQQQVEVCEITAARS